MTWHKDFGILGEGKSRNPLLLTQNNDRLWNLLLQSTNLGVYVLGQGHDDFGTFTGTEPPNLHPHLLKPAEIFETTVLRLQAKKNKNKHDF